MRAASSLQMERLAFYLSIIEKNCTKLPLIKVKYHQKRGGYFISPQRVTPYALFYASYFSIFEA